MPIANKEKLTQYLANNLNVLCISNIKHSERVCKQISVSNEKIMDFVREKSLKLKAFAQLMKNTGIIHHLH